MQVRVELLGSGGVQMEGSRLQDHLQGFANSSLHTLRQALHVAIQQPEHCLLPLICGRLQRMPEVTHLGPHNFALHSGQHALITLPVS